MNTEQVKKEFAYKTSRSGGAGGQHVNKVETKVEVAFHVSSSLAFTDAEMLLLISNVAADLTNEGLLQTTAQETRSQATNKEIAEKKMLRLLQNALIVPVERKAARPNKAAIRQRLDNKNAVGAKKVLRKKVSISSSDTDFFL